ncbi:hypothetical protein CIB48_g9321 [Xylaria polymorpha]|nr:hypothetical protein CIB48_g9321 [Xylaria polymorpha]
MLAAGVDVPTNNDNGNDGEDEEREREREREREERRIAASGCHDYRTLYAADAVSPAVASLLVREPALEESARPLLAMMTFSVGGTGT